MTVEEVLKQSGLSDEQIKALDAKAVSAFTTVLTTATTAQVQAQQAKEAAELAQRAQREMYDQQIAPALDSWASEKANLEATAAFYRTQAEKAKEGGFLPADLPGAPPRTAQDPATGKFVAGGNEVPGSPKYMTIDEGWSALSGATQVMLEHQRLYGTPLPDDIGSLAREATANHMKVSDWAAKKYKFEEKKTELAAAKQKEHDDAIRKEVTAQVTKEFTEKFAGGNPDLRVAQSSQYSTVARAVKDGSHPDPLKMTREQRHEATRTAIQKDIAENSTVQ